MNITRSSIDAMHYHADDDKELPEKHADQLEESIWRIFECTNTFPQINSHIYPSNLKREYILKGISYYHNKDAGADELRYYFYFVEME